MFDKSVFRHILDIISYEGDKDKHAQELTELLTESINIKTYEAVKEFFEQYFKAVEPALSEEQKTKLQEYFEKLQKESTPAADTSAQ